MIKRRPMSQILQLTSIDSTKVVEDFCTVKEIIDHYVKEIYESPKARYYLKLREAMIRGEYPPIHVCLGRMAEMDYSDLHSECLPRNLLGKLVQCNGHHRVRIAYDLGWNSILTTDKIIESDRY